MTTFFVHIDMERMSTYGLSPGPTPHNLALVLEHVANDMKSSGITGTAWTANAAHVGSYGVADTFDADPKFWTAERKVEVMEAMGFTPMYDAHQPDCPARMDSGFICQCVPDPTYWTPPEDVVEFRHETWEERRAAAIKRQEKQR